MKKISTFISPLLCFLLAGMGFALGQNQQNNYDVQDADVSVCSPTVSSPAGQTKWEPASMQLLFDNGPLVNQPGAGTGGADVSALHDGLITYGFGHAVAAGYRVADDFTVPAGQTWKIDSIVFYAYQTNSPTTSSMTEVHLAVRNASPLTNPSPSAIIWGDTVTNVLAVTGWTGIYRTNSTTFSSTARPIMQNQVDFSILPLLQLSPGTYWLDWTTAGSLTSGPWVPPVTYPTQMATGDAVQFSGVSFTWNALIDTAQAGTGDDSPQGLPFKIYGVINSSTNDLYLNNDVTIFPNPMTHAATVMISEQIRQESSGFSFTVYDIAGKLVAEKNEIKTNRFPISSEDIPAGMYIYEVKNGNELIKRGKLSVVN